MRAASALAAVVLVAAILVLVTARARSAGSALASPPDAAYPRSAAACAGTASDDDDDSGPDNGVANRTSPAGPVPWSQAPAMTHWRRWIAARAQVTGRFGGSTDQILAWAACRWGLEPDLLRAVAAQESDWHQDKVGDGGESFGIMQIKDHYRDGSVAWGGYPDTARSTALNVDFYAAYIRSCVDGDFADGGDWLYRGRTIDEVIAAHGLDYAVWGCVGSWYSGSWYDEQAAGYIADVRRLLSQRYWRSIGRP